MDPGLSLSVLSRSLMSMRAPEQKASLIDGDHDYACDNHVSFVLDIDTRVTTSKL